MIEIKGINNFNMYNEDGVLYAKFEAMVKKEGKHEIESMDIKVNDEILELSTKLQNAVIKAKAGE